MALVIQTVPVGTLTEDPENTRLHPDDNLEAVVQSLARFGQRVPIVVRGGVVVAGNARLKAMARLGWKECHTVSADDLTQEEADAFAIADNRTAELAVWDEEKLAAALAQVMDGTDYDAIRDGSSVSRSSPGSCSATLGDSRYRSE